MDFSAQLQALIEETRKRFEWEQYLLNSIAEHRNAINNADVNLAERLATAIAPAQRPAPQPLETVEQEWQRLRNGAQ